MVLRIFRRGLRDSWMPYAGADSPDERWGAGLRELKAEVKGACCSREIAQFKMSP